MYIKEIIIDGFKSYSQRTEIKNFDQEFNAITGLNGSGKSNILDSICFVLGISNLSQVRVNNLQELIYKNGQAGITKATVSLIFDNSFKAQSPIGYDNSEEIIITRQIISGGKNKYLINGYNSTNQRVSDLFRSVNLNVNNPHFLIMQGRITKVLNMKAIEILSLIEETVGTKLYDTKRNSALKIIEKKDSKLEEIHKVIKEEIMPLLEKLNKDKASYLDYQKITQDLDHFDKIYKAYIYWNAQESLEKYQTKLSEVMLKIQCNKSDIAKKDLMILSFDTYIHELEKKLGKEKGNNIEHLEGELGELKREDSKMESKTKNADQNLSHEKQKLKEIQNSLIDEEKQKKTNAKIMNDYEIPLQKLEQNFKDAQVDCSNAQTRLQACNTGMFEVQEGGESTTLTQQFIKLQSKLAELQTEKEQIQMKLTHAQSNLRGELEKSNNFSRHEKIDLPVQEKEFKDNIKLLHSIEKTLDTLQNELKSHAYHINPDEMDADKLLKVQLQSRNQLIANIQNEIGLKEGNYPELKFDFSDFANMKSSEKVKGKILNLINALTNQKYCRAIEVAAGGRLNNVVVDTEQTAKQILMHGKLVNRTTFIPLNKITPKYIKNSIIELATQIGGGSENVIPMIDIIKYTDENIRLAMQFVFGNTLFCKDIDTAKKIAFHPQIKLRCVTLDGDILEPYGTVSGGYHNPSSFSALSKSLEINELKNKLADLIMDTDGLASQFDKIKENQNKYQEINRLIELKSRDMNMLNFKIKNNHFYLLQQEMEDTKKLIDDEGLKLKAVICQISETESNIADIKLKLSDVDSFQENQIKLAKLQVEKSKTHLDDLQNQLKDSNMEYEKLKVAIMENDKYIENYKISITEVQTNIIKAETDFINLKLEHQKIKGLEIWGFAL
ncbi:structural maintenance of chromosomes protein 2-like [Gordionus sp. m RMFG-2023]|uniref:structural maintenance of chromosomes protein 2-like n=1 Tax=Gordionus sp. m RMFG-2023 TaxID=3053472 RepID=UPI0031FD414D